MLVLCDFSSFKIVCDDDLCVRFNLTNDSLWVFVLIKWVLRVKSMISLIEVCLCILQAAVICFCTYSTNGVGNFVHDFVHQWLLYTQIQILLSLISVWLLMGLFWIPWVVSSSFVKVWLLLLPKDCLDNLR